MTGSSVNVKSHNMIHVLAFLCFHTQEMFQCTLMKLPGALECNAVPNICFYMLYLHGKKHVTPDLNHPMLE